MDVNAKVEQARANHTKAQEIMHNPTTEQYGLWEAQCLLMCATIDLLDVLQYLAREKDPPKDYPNPT